MLYARSLSTLLYCYCFNLIILIAGIAAMKANIHALSGIGSHDASVRESEDISCFSGHYDRHISQ
jgi:hypothetical protein